MINIRTKELDIYFEKFVKYVKEQDENGEVNFYSGFLDKEEGYKAEIAKKAIQEINYQNWKKEDIGKGIFTNEILESMTFSYNLVKYQNVTTYGNKLKQNIAQSDKLFYDLFVKNKEKEVFEKLRKSIGSIYSFIAYIYFIYSDDKYLPIATTYFDKAFKLVNINLKTSRNCNFQNYQEFLNINKEIKNYLREKLNEKDIRLIDAHSFLWIISDINEQIEKLKNEETECKPLKTQEIQQEKENKTPTNKKPNSNIIYDETYKKRQELGRTGENIVIKRERKYLRKKGKPELADKVKDNSNRPGLGYDVLSFELDGQKKQIEAKTMNSGNQFFITRNELNKSKELSNYYIYIVSKTNKKPIIEYIHKPNFGSNHFKFEPETYRVNFKRKK